MLLALEELVGERKFIGTSLELVANRHGPDSSHVYQLALTAAGERITETLLARFLLRHYRLQSLLSWQRGEAADGAIGYLPFNGFAFSASGFSWLRPLVGVRNGTSRPKPVLLDVYNRDCYLEDVDGFVERVDRAGRVAKLVPLPIVAATTFTQDAFNRAKREGLLAIRLRDLFGDAAIEALGHIESLARGVSALDVDQSVELDEGGFTTLFGSLKTHPFISDLRGMALEAVSALLIRAQGWEDVKMGLDVPYEGTTRDIDVLGTRHGGEDLAVVECKAIASDAELPSHDVVKFYTETVPALIKHKAALLSSRPHTVDAQIWTTGVVGTDANAALSSIKLPRGVTPTLLGLRELRKVIRRPLKRCERLLQVIAASSSTEVS